MSIEVAAQLIERQLKLALVAEVRDRLDDRLQLLGIDELQTVVELTTPVVRREGMSVGLTLRLAPGRTEFGAAVLAGPGAWCTRRRPSASARGRDPIVDRTGGVGSRGADRS